MKKFIYALVTLFAITSLSSKAQNLSQLDAIHMLNGFWTTQVGINLNIIGEDRPVTRKMTASGAINKQYDNWNIHTNTLDFSSGTIQATNTSPFHNDNYKYRFLTPTTCEFFLNGQWVPARKGGGNNVVTPVNNNNNVLRPTNDNNVNPTNNNVIITPANNNRPTNNNNRPTNNNININRPGNNNNNTVIRPTDNNNNSNRPVNNNNSNRPVNNNNTNQPVNNNEVRDGSGLQLFFPPDVPGTIAPTNNNTNNNTNTQRPVITPDNNNTIRPGNNSNNNNIIITPVDSGFAPPTHNNSSFDGRTTIDNNSFNPNTPTNSNSNSNVQRPTNNNQNITNPVRSTRQRSSGNTRRR